MEYTYAGSPMSVSSNGSLTDIIGSFYCQNNSELCVEDVFGRQWRPAQAENLITVVPSIACMEGGRYHRCGVFLLFVASRPSSTSDMVTSTMEGIRYHDMFKDGKFLHFADYVYVPIRGFSCNSCRENYCRPHQRLI
ncbi:unnamed protein product [Cylicocyclus nassatus]|uniref:Uncharacterized protein n=1 Tax=Cylicocyclus nassatus TaxID=53992 RepID=A0AA36MB91_CYLNA|nr:unnamed protein product [Cylicocyclus nassatus]